MLLNLPEDSLTRFVQLNLVTWIKGKPKEDERLKIRLNDVGKKLFDSLDIPEASEGDCQMASYLFEMYLAHEDTERVLGNKKAITRYIAILRNHLGITLHQFYYLCEFFLAEYPYTRKLENIFMDKNKIRYGDFKSNIDSSVLFQFYEQKQREIEHYWSQKIK